MYLIEIRFDADVTSHRQCIQVKFSVDSESQNSLYR